MKYEECSIVTFFFEGAVLILIDNIHIWMSSVLIWSLFFCCCSEKWGGPGLDDMKGGGWTPVTRVFSVMALGHCYSESSCNAEAWPLLACPSGHIRDCAFSCEQTACREPRRKARLQITGTPLWSFWPRSTNNNNSGSAQWDKDRFNIRHHGSC